MFSRFKEFFKFRSSTGDNEKSDDKTSDDQPSDEKPIDDVNLKSDSSVSENAAALEDNGPAAVVYPTGKNEMASSAITNKLTEIAEVAEALDSALRDTQNGLDLVEMNSSPPEKKMDHNHQHHHHSNHHPGNNIEDWHSRSTDESFATVSEGNFTPHSHSSSFQTASEGRTPSFQSSGKTSFDSSDLEETTSQIFPLDMLSPGNISFDGSSEPSFVSAQQSLTTSPQSVPPDSGIDSTSEFKSIAEERGNLNDEDDDEDSHSRSATPTPGNTSTCELTTLDIQPQTIIDNTVLPESTSIDEGHDVAAAFNDGDEDEVSSSVCSTKPTDSWRSKYYGHVTKQTIKGCL